MKEKMQHVRENLEDTHRIKRLLNNQSEQFLSKSLDMGRLPIFSHNYPISSSLTVLLPPISRTSNHSVVVSRVPSPIQKQVTDAYFIKSLKS